MKPIVKAVFFLVALVAATFVISHGIAFAAGDAAPSPAKEAFPWWLVAGIVAGAVSEILSLIPSLKSNGVVQLILNIIGTVFGKKE